MIRTLLFIGLITPFAWPLQAQEARKTAIQSSQKQEVDGVSIPDSYVDAQWITMEAPQPDGTSVREYLVQRKIEQTRLHPRKPVVAELKTMMDSLLVTDGQNLVQQLPTGFEIPLYGGIPNDNSLAVSNGGIVLLAFNSHIAGYDLNTGEQLYSQGRYPLGLIGIDFDGPSTNFYDPKVAYDPVRDRFVLAFLRGNTPTSSGIILAFSKTNDPRDGWNVYALPGNPLNNDRWTDFPVIALTAHELIFTANFIIPGQPWQTGFDGSMIWQIGLDEGFTGAATLDALLWSDIKFNGRFTRNLHAVQFGDAPDRDDIFLLSNRNFSLQNDTIFLLHLTGMRTDANTTLEVNAHLSDQPYGVPPFARQADTDTTNAASGFDTNDGRVLGAFFVNDHIQFVSNTIDFASGHSAIYHGRIDDPYATNPMISGTIIQHPRLDLGYPNVAWTGTQACEHQSILGFNHTSTQDPAGCSALFFSDEGEYSPITYLTKGEGYVNRHAGNYERWGDYFGLQRVYNQPGQVWASGYYGYANQNNGIYSARVYSPDTLHLRLTVNANPGNALCQARVQALAINGQAPFTYTINGQPSVDGISEGHCAGDKVSISVTDASGCTRTDSVIIPLKNQSVRRSVYPNPTDDLLVSRIDLPSAGKVQLLLTDLNGRELTVITERFASAGLYEVVMDLSQISAGTYVLKLFLDGEELNTQKVLVR